MTHLRHHLVEGIVFMSKFYPWLVGPTSKIKIWDLVISGWYCNVAMSVVLLNYVVVAEKWHLTIWVLIICFHEWFYHYFLLLHLLMLSSWCFIYLNKIMVVHPRMHMSGGLTFLLKKNLTIRQPLKLSQDYFPHLQIDPLICSLTPLFSDFYIRSLLSFLSSLALISLPATTLGQRCISVTSYTHVLWGS
jgi:hypothetical protein